MHLTLGAAIYIAVKPILKIYTIIFVGFLLARFNIVDMECAKGISNMVVNAILPCLTFNKIVSNISWHDIKEIGVIALSGIILFCTGTACALATNYITHAPKYWFWGLLFTGLFPNISDLPISYTQSLGGGVLFTDAEANKGVAYSCIFLMVQSLLQMNLGLWRILGFDAKYTEEHLDEILENQNKRNTKEEIEESNSTGSNSSTIIIERRKYQEEKKVGKFNHHHIISNTSDVSISSIDSNNTVITDIITEDQPIAYHQVDKNKSMIQKTNSIISSPGILEGSCMKKLLTETSSHNKSWKRNPHYYNQGSDEDNLKRLLSNYSAVGEIRSGRLDLSKPLDLTQEIGRTNTELLVKTGGGSLAEDIQDTNGILEEQHSERDDKQFSRKERLNRFIDRHRLGWARYLVVNFFRPASLGGIVGMTVALIPWLQAIFVNTYVHVHKAPDHLPVLNFLVDFSSYIGNACIPLGLLLLGGTMARLQVSSIPRSFLVTAAAMTCCRLVVLPVIGILWANKLYTLNWLETPVSKFVMILTWSMPSATSQVYFTAFFTSTDGPHLQYDCISVFFLMQYAVLIISLPFVITYTLKVDMKY